MKKKKKTIIRKNAEELRHKDIVIRKDDGKELVVRTVGNNGIARAVVGSRMLEVTYENEPGYSLVNTDDQVKVLQ